MSLIKHYWFSILMGLLIAVFMVMLILILIAPKQDARSRGFIPCTQSMVDQLIECERKLWCSGGAIVQNAWCDLKVIGAGFKDWTVGKQPRPWSNYIFKAELPLNSMVDEEARQDYLKQYPNVQQEMENLHKLRKELENEQNQQDAMSEIWPTDDDPSQLGSDGPLQRD